MALQGPWGTYIHIYKTGGMSVRKMLTDEFKTPGTEIESFHTAPLRIEGFTFTVVRNPVYWLRSFWAYYLHKGTKKKNFIPNWHIAVSLMGWLEHTRWDEYVDMLYQCDIDYPLTIYSMFTDSPLIHVYQLENIEPLAKRLGIRKEALQSLHTTSIVPDITDSQMRKLKHVTRTSRRKYGYTPE